MIFLLLSPTQVLGVPKCYDEAPLQSKFEAVYSSVCQNWVERQCKLRG